MVQNERTASANPHRTAGKNGDVFSAIPGKREPLKKKEPIRRGFGPPAVYRRPTTSGAGIATDESEGESLDPFLVFRKDLWYSKTLYILLGNSLKWDCVSFKLFGELRHPYS